MPQQWDDAGAADLAACATTLQGGSRSFFAASRLLPRPVRDPAMALYAFCRDADDLIDDEADAGGIERVRARLALIYDGRPMPIAADRAFARVVERFAIPRALPDALIEGFAWDIEGRRYADLPALRAYAVRVAGTVGAMMALLMGVRDAARIDCAIDLGVAMQLSNIARDVGEDARTGRLYLPLDWLAAVGIDPARFLASPRYTPELGAVIRRVLDAAGAHYRRSAAGIARLPLSCRFAIATARILYAEIGHEVGRRGHDSVTSRAVVSRRRKAGILLRDVAWVALARHPLHPTLSPDAAWLREAVLRQRRQPEIRAASWWRPSSQVETFIDLLERLEQRERVRL